MKLRAVAPSGPAPTDPELVVAAVEGARWAQEAIFRRYARLVSSSACLAVVMSVMTPTKYGTPSGVRWGKSAARSHSLRPVRGAAYPNSARHGVWFTSDSSAARQN